jgi:hypothetical protein
MAYFNFSLPDYVEWISPRPILLIIGEHAHSRTFSEDAYAAPEPKELYIVPNANHVDLYDKTDLICSTRWRSSSPRTSPATRTSPLRGVTGRIARSDMRATVMHGAATSASRTSPRGASQPTPWRPR